MREHFVYAACKSLTGCSYFTKDDHQGVCVFRRRRTSEDGHRGFRLSSLGILLAKSPRARPWQHVAALKQLVNTIYTSLEDRDTLEPMESDWDPARTFFEERKVRDEGSSGTWEGWDSELEGTRSDCAPTTHLPHLLRILGPSSLTLYKHILGRRRVLVITRPPVEAACILCQVAADTCYEEQVSELVSGYDSDEGDDEPPRRLKGKSTGAVKVLGMVTLNDLDKLEFESKSGRGWIVELVDAGVSRELRDDRVVVPSIGHVAGYPIDIVGTRVAHASAAVGDVDELELPADRAGLARHYSAKWCGEGPAHRQVASIEVRADFSALDTVSAYLLLMATQRIA